LQGKGKTGRGEIRCLFFFAKEAKVSSKNKWLHSTSLLPRFVGTLYAGGFWLGFAGGHGVFSLIPVGTFFRYTDFDFAVKA
jgi:hypothetical protein